MTIRRPLLNQLYKAWKKTISKHYKNCQINSERSLQASLWSHLVHELPHNRRTFIEPRIFSESRKAPPRLYPDLVVCNSNKVIAVVEIKYTPRVDPQYEKDRETLGWISDHRSTLYVVNSRYRGDTSMRQRFDFADDVLFVWASIHRLPTTALNAKEFTEKYTSLMNSFVLIQAETQADEKPIVGYEFG